MGYLTADEARVKICWEEVYVIDERLHSYQHCCYADACAKWRWNRDVNAGLSSVGYCGLAGKPEVLTIHE